MSNRNSVVILSKNIKMDREYSNIIDYTESQMVSLCESNDHLVAKQNDNSFLRVNENIINVGIPYNECIKANYIAMQNKSFANKWFFAFIDKVEYNSESSTNIYYTIDEISTWWDYWTKKSCFVVREHVNDDTLGLHTIPEGLETGEYICNNTVRENNSIGITTIMASTLDPNDKTNIISKYNGVPTGCAYYRYDSVMEGLPMDSDMIDDINKLAGSQDAIVGMFIAPKWLSGGSSEKNGLLLPTNVPSYDTILLADITSLDGYTPKNKKVLTFPYCYIEVSNATGQANTLKQEVWTKNLNGYFEFRMAGCLTPGCSIRGYPLNYNNIAENIDEGISLGKYPQLNWNTDHYTNWLVQNGVSIGALKLDAVQSNIASAGINTALDISKIASGDPAIATAGAEQLGNTASNMWNFMQEKYHHSLVPPTLHGSLNCGDVITATLNNRFSFYYMSIKNEFAKSIDDYFTRFGYQVNKLKMPNYTGRTYWNYVKISSGEIVGYSNNQNVNIPKTSMDTINKVFRNGTTIWHNHTNIGNYDLNNTIVS